MRILNVALVLAAGFLSAAGVAAAESACADLRGTVDPGGICRVHAANSVYTLDMSFPDDYPDQAPLTAYLTQARDGFVNVAEMPGSYNLPYQLDAKGAGYRSGPPTGGTRSVVFTMWQNVGGVAEAFTRRRSIKHSTGISPSACRSRSTACSSRAPSRST